MINTRNLNERDIQTLKYIRDRILLFIAERTSKIIPRGDFIAISDATIIGALLPGSSMKVHLQRIRSIDGHYI